MISATISPCAEARCASIGSPGHVADGVDAAHRGPALVVDAKERAVHVEVDRIQAPALRRGFAANRQRGSGRPAAARSVRPPPRSASASPLRGESLCLGAGQHLDAELAQAPGHRPRQFRVVLRQNAGLGFDDGHRGAQLGEGGPQFEPDIAGPHHDKPVRHFGQGQRSGRGDHLAAERKQRQFDRHWSRWRSPPVQRGLSAGRSPSPPRPSCRRGNAPSPRRPSPPPSSTVPRHRC